MVDKKEKNLTQALPYVVSLGLTISMFYGFLSFQGGIIYKGTINNAKIKYSEKKMFVQHIEPIGLGYNQDYDMEDRNIMIVEKKDGTKLILEDHLLESKLRFDIQYPSPYDKEELENVIMKIDGNTFSYSPSDINDSTRDGKHAREILDKANKEYNQLRAEIVKIKVAEYESQYKSIEDKLAK